MFALIETNRATHIAIHVPHNGADKSLPALAAMLEMNAVFIQEGYNQLEQVKPKMTIELGDEITITGRDAEISIQIPANSHCLEDSFILATAEAYISNKKAIDQRDERIVKLCEEIAFLKVSLQRLQTQLDESKQEVDRMME
ncbi:MAG: hypothetical protein LW834_06515 [Cyanobium sp. 49614_E6]|jgi:DNA-binding transcriptional regulator YhcF (GntR family)|nr:hypothetical protein [Cyanobium sp. 49614_E6]